VAGSARPGRDTALSPLPYNEPLRDENQRWRAQLEPPTIASMETVHRYLFRQRPVRTGLLAELAGLRSGVDGTVVGHLHDRTLAASPA